MLQPIPRPDNPHKPFFSVDELKCKCGLCNEGKLDGSFSLMLPQLRMEYNAPMQVNSCCRCTEYNKRIGGHPRSLHVWDFPVRDNQATCAIDIHMTDDEKRARLMYVALLQGWSVGVYKTFLHLDTRTHSAGLVQKVFIGDA